MTQGQGELASRLCPRCGGLMIRPLGSTLYWHADNHHPRCDITNIADAPATQPATATARAATTKAAAPGKKKQR